jgi:2-methylcitrate dehydratase PrpD
MAVATLNELSDEQAMHALGNAGTQSSGFWEFLETGAMSKHLHAGRAAESGLIAAQLAKLDFTGPPAVLEGKKGFFAAACPDANPEVVIADADAPWELRQTSIKPWPCCRHTHPAIDAALALHEELAGISIESVQVVTYQAALDVCNRPTPDSEYEAKFSLYHTVAAALEFGKVDFNSFDAKARTDLAEMRNRVTVNAAEPWNSNYPVSWGARVRVITAEGGHHSSERHGARGDPEHALDDQEMIDKARMLLKLADMDDSVAGQFIDSILQLTNSDDAERAIGFLSEQFR